MLLESQGDGSDVSISIYYLSKMHSNTSDGLLATPALLNEAIIRRGISVEILLPKGH